MTAVALRWVGRCGRHVQVSPTVSAGAAQWLVAAQDTDGSWQMPPTAAPNDPRAQAPLPLTAYALLALLQTKVTVFYVLQNFLKYLMPTFKRFSGHQVYLLQCSNFFYSICIYMVTPTRNC